MELRKKTLIKKNIIYFIGLLILALGITMNTKTNLGVSPLISIPYTISEIWGVKLGLATFSLDMIFILMQRIMLGKDFDKKQYMQILISFLTSLFVQMYAGILPTASSKLESGVMLIFAIIFTGLGITVTVATDLVINPGDGLTKVISIKLNKSMGVGKNIFDFSCMFIAIIIGLVFNGSVIGIGLGTIATMLFTGVAVNLWEKCLARIHKAVTK